MVLGLVALASCGKSAGRTHDHEGHDHGVEAVAHDHAREGHDHEDKGCVSQLFQTQVGRSQSGVEHPEDGRTLPDGQWFFLPASPLAFKYVFLEKQAFSPVAYREKLHAACLATNRAGRAPPAMY